MAPASCDSPARCKPRSSTGRRHILVVDDEIPVLGMMQQQLRKLGYRVITRADSVEAKNTFRANPDQFDLVITDHTMPGLLGADLAGELGAIRPNLPVILMTGLNQPPDLAAFRHAPLRFVFQKPINFVELSHRLRNFLDRPGGHANGCAYANSSPSQKRHRAG